MSPPDAETRALEPGEAALVAQARETAFVLYEGRRVPHRSCGIALAETFGLATGAYQSLRRGGITGEGGCGSIKAGELILGEVLGDPDPTGAVTPALRQAIAWYQREVPLRIAPLRIDQRPATDHVCNNLTRPHGDFAGPRRRAFCTALTADVAALTAEAILRFSPAPDLHISQVPEA